MSVDMMEVRFVSHSIRTTTALFSTSKGNVPILGPSRIQLAVNSQFFFFWGVFLVIELGALLLTWSRSGPCPIGSAFLIVTAMILSLIENQSGTLSSGRTGFHLLMELTFSMDAKGWRQVPSLII
jgi:hypothetical protein